MKFGYFAEFEQTLKTSLNVSEMYRDYIEQVCYAEQHGFESVWVLEHHFTEAYSYCSAPEILLATLAARTSTMRIGPGVCLLPYHNPVTVAERYATLDVLSGGRLEFGIGRGVANFEWNKFRTDGYEQSRDIMYEALELILKCWTQDSVVHNGRYYTVKEPINVIPKPGQKPHPRIHVAGTSPESAGLYGSLGWNVLGICNFYPSIEIARQARSFSEGRARSKGPKDAEFSVIVFVHCAASDAEANSRISPYHKWFYTTMGKSYGMEKDSNPANLAARYIRGEADFGDFKQGGMIISGSPDTCVKLLKDMESAGVDRTMCQFRLGLMPHHEVMESLALFSREVLPAFAKQPGGTLAGGSTGAA
jgi:alkanesulfonate monooxygenase SsuD/methylene tetrahydromethanopterin reductase-like flavin-dependent oxidoreductase (luciferase family)